MDVNGPGRTGKGGEIAYLRMYSEVYRTHLRTYLEALLRNVDEWARAEQSPASVEHDGRC